MSTTMNPPRWYDVYSQGTIQGDEEVKFFKCIARNKEHTYRSIGAIAKETGLTRERVEEIVAKYHPKGIIVQSSKNEDLYGYWEVAGVKKKEKSVSSQDKEQRIKKKKDDDN